MLTLENLQIQRDDRCITQDINLSILPGGIFNFYGPNGVGKTTLLKTIENFEARDGAESLGRIILNSAPYSVCDSIYLGLEHHLYSDFTVAENLEFFGIIYDNELATNAVATVFGLQDKLQMPYKELSTGWQRKCVLSLLLLARCNIWLLDEPYFGLDEEASNLLQQIIKTKCASGGIVLLTSHQVINDFDIVNYPLERLAI